MPESGPEPGRPTIIAVDGPVAAGKGTLARRLAAHFGLRHLDSGMLYRAIAARILNAGGDPSDSAQAIAAALAFSEDQLATTGLRDEAVGRGASLVSVIPRVRAAMLDYQRSFGRTPPGAVIDGRDIGTVVFPDATHKLFVTANLDTRVDRRYKELRDSGVACDREQVMREMIDRDTRDRERAIAPLVPAHDAVMLDTSGLDADAVFEAGLAAIAARSRE